MKSRILFVLLLSLLLGAVALWYRNPDRLGRPLPSLTALKTVQKGAGYLPIGYFGDNWPATIVEVRTSPDTITFARRGGSRHTYRGFEGYRLKMVRLQGPSQGEVIVVFRSETAARDTENGENREEAVRRM